MLDNDMPVPAWFMMPVGKLDESNVELFYKKTAITLAVSNHPEQPCTMQVPCYRNVTALKKGDELKVYREKKVAEKRPLAKRGSSACYAPSKKMRA